MSALYLIVSDYFYVQFLGLSMIIVIIIILASHVDENIFLIFFTKLEDFDLIYKLFLVICETFRYFNSSDKHSFH